MFDEPSSYLDVRQRLRAARTIRSLLQPSTVSPFFVCVAACVRAEANHTVALF